MIFLTDRYYGHAAILSWYCGLDSPRPVLAHLQHGWNPRTGFGDKDLLKGRVGLSQSLPKLVWSSNNVYWLRQQGFRHAHAVGSPFTYLLAMIGGVVTADHLTRGGARSAKTLVYPHHHQGTRMDEDYASALRDREDGEVRVTLHSRDFGDDRVRSAYEAAGFAVSCHGRRDDPLFLFRQREALLDCDRVVTNRVSTALWYAALLGCDVEVYGPVSDSWSEARGTAWDVIQHERWPFLFSGALDQEEAKAAGREELGVEHLRQPEELARLLGWNGPARFLGTALNGVRTLQRRCLPQGIVRKRVAGVTSV